MAEKVRIDNLPEAELRALLDEAVKYRGKTRDGGQRTELFQVIDEERLSIPIQTHLTLC